MPVVNKASIVQNAHDKSLSKIKPRKIFRQCDGIVVFFHERSNIIVRKIRAWKRAMCYRWWLIYHQWKYTCSYDYILHKLLSFLFSLLLSSSSSLLYTYLILSPLAKNMRSTYYNSAEAGHPLVIINRWRIHEKDPYVKNL